MTLTEGSVSRHHSSASSSPLSSQSCSAVADHDAEPLHETIMPLDTEKEEEEDDLHESEETGEPAPKVLLSSLTKDSQEEPMEFSTSAVKTEVEENTQASVDTELVGDIDQNLEIKHNVQSVPHSEEVNEEEEVASEHSLCLEVNVPECTESSPPLEMVTTPGSELSFSGFSSPATEDKTPSLKRSPAFSPDSSAKLYQSPFSLEASPRHTPGLNNSYGYSSGVPPAAFFPITPKIGMGKPAISKRKFSPGRPRVKQVG